MSSFINGQCNSIEKKKRVVCVVPGKEIYYICSRSSSCY